MFNFFKSLNRLKLKHSYFFGKFKAGFAPVHGTLQKSNYPWKIVFYGTDELSLSTLKVLNQERISLSPHKVISTVDVVCIKSDCPVRKYATVSNLKIHTWPYDLPRDVYDIGIVVSFGYMIPAESIHACKYGMINAHPSLLPRWRGASPIVYTILKGDKETGLTVTQVSPNKFDVGKILLQERFQIPEDYTSKLLLDDFKKVTPNMVMKTLKHLLQYIETSYPQANDGQTYARKLKPHMGLINWEQDTALTVQRKYRAFSGHIDIYTFWQGIRVFILECAKLYEVQEAKVSSLVEKSLEAPGFCYFHKKRKVVYVKCKEEWYGIKEFKIPKKGRITAQDFYNGFISKVSPANCYFASNDNKSVEN